MRHFPFVLICLFGYLVAADNIDATEVLQAIALPAASGRLLGASFSIDSSRLAVFRSSEGGRENTLQVIDLKSLKQVNQATVLPDESATQMLPHPLEYSSDGRYLLLSTSGSDVLSIIDASTLKSIKTINLHREQRSGSQLARSEIMFRGVFSLTASAKNNIFAVLRRDAQLGNEIFVGSFSSGDVVGSWMFGKGRTSDLLGGASLSLSEDGAAVLASSLPNENELPKLFKNLSLFESKTGRLSTSIGTKWPAGKVKLLADNSALATRVGIPGLFSKKACIEKWSLNSGSLDRQFCDQGRDVVGLMDAAPFASRVVGFAAHIHKTLEGSVANAPGRVDVWNLESGSLIAVSSEFPGFLSTLRVSRNGEWILAGHQLLHLSSEH